MCSNISITDFLELGDENLRIYGKRHELIKGIDYLIYEGVITYRPKVCPKCGCVNENNSIIKNGSQKVKVQINKINGLPCRLDIKKQRFFCKDCNSSFIAKTSLTKKGCFISHLVKESVVENLLKFRTIKDIAQENNIAWGTVTNILNDVSEKVKKNYLPEKLGIDELKISGKAMSVDLVDLDTGKIYDILPNRYKSQLISYFESYPLWVREKVKIVSTDMYMPYIDTAKTIFKNAKIVVDKFHIVQLIKNNLKSIRVELMKRKTTSQRDYKILKRYWKLLLKKEWDLNSTKFNRFTYFKEFTCPYDIVRYMLSLDEDMQNAYNFYQSLLVCMNTNDVNHFKRLMSIKLKDIHVGLRKSFRTLRRMSKYIINALESGCSNGKVEAKNNVIKTYTKISFGVTSTKNIRNRLLLREKIKIDSITKIKYDAVA